MPLSLGRGAVTCAVQPLSRTRGIKWQVATDTTIPKGCFGTFLVHFAIASFFVTAQRAEAHSVSWTLPEIDRINNSCCLHNGEGNGVCNTLENNVQC